MMAKSSPKPTKKDASDDPKKKRGKRKGRK